MRARVWLTHPVVDLLIRVAAVLSLIIGGYAAVKSYQQSRCQAAYNEINNERTRALYESANTEREARRQVILTEGDLWDAVVAHPSTNGMPDPVVAEKFAAHRESIAQYRVAWNDLQADTEAHPIPPPPSQKCG